MKKLLIFLVLVGCTSLTYSQTLIQTFTDRCTGATQVFQISMTGTTTVVFYDRAQTFTAADVQSGAFQAWLQETYAWWSALNPCSAAQAESQTAQQTTQQTTSAATSAASNATSSSPPPSTGSTNTSSTNASSSTNNTSSNSSSSGSSSSESTNNNTSGSSEQSQNESSSSSSGGETSESSGGGETTDSESGETQETKTEETSSESDGGSQEENQESESKTEESSEDTKEEEVKEESKEESKEEESKEEESKEEESKEEESSEEESESEEEESSEDSESSDEEEEEKEKKKKSLAPPILAANMMGNQMLDGTWTTAASFGISQSSLTGQETYSANAMIWSNLKQFSLGLSKSKVHFWRERQIFSEVITSTGKRRVTQGDPVKQNQIHHVGTTTFNYMNIYGTNVITVGYSRVILGQNENFWKGFAGGYAATNSIIILPESTLYSPALTFFGTKPVNFKSLPRWSFAPMVAISLTPLQVINIKNEFNKNQAQFVWNEYFTYIAGTNINFNLTQRFTANLGINTINNTNPIIPTTFAITIGARFAF